LYIRLEIDTMHFLKRPGPTQSVDNFNITFTIIEHVAAVDPGHLEEQEDRDVEASNGHWTRSFKRLHMVDIA